MGMARIHEMGTYGSDKLHAYIRDVLVQGSHKLRIVRVCDLGGIQDGAEKCISTQNYVVSCERTKDGISHAAQGSLQQSRLKPLNLFWAGPTKEMWQ